MPAGLVGDDDASDTLESAARRELIEETGWDAARIDVLLVGPTTAGMSNERIPFARARDLTRVGDGGGVDDEDRQSVVSGKSVSARVDLGGRRLIQKKKTTNTRPST